MILRALEPEDIDFLYWLENERSLWEVSDTQLPFARHLLEDYLYRAKQDIYEAKQFRYVIADEDNTAMGCVDIYDFSPKHLRASVGIALLPQYRGMGYGITALTLLIDNVRNYFDLHQLVAYIPMNNTPSLHLFEKVGFKPMAVLKDWLYWRGKFEEVAVMNLVVS